MTDQKTMLRKQIYIALGLSDKEALLYDLLLTQGEMSGGEIERVSGLKKNTYTLLKSLEQKKLVLTNQKSGKRYYLPSSPDTLMVLLAEQRRAVLQTQATIEAVLPELMDSYRAKVGRPIVQYYSGITGLRAVFDKVYEEGKEVVYGAFGNEVPSEKIFEEMVKKYGALRVKRGIKAITISPDGERARELKKREKLDLKEKFLVDSKKYPMPAEFDTWGDYVAMMSFTRGDYQALLIQNPEFAQAFQSLLRLASDLLRQLETQNLGNNT